MVIGDCQTFAIEVLEPFSGAQALHCMQLHIAGSVIGTTTPVHVGTVAGQLEGFRKTQRAHGAAPNELLCLSGKDAFDAFHAVMNGTRSIEGLSQELVWNVYYMHSIDELLDEWEVYVHDFDNETKRILWASRSAGDDTATMNRSVSIATIERDVFDNVIRDFVRTTGG